MVRPNGSVIARESDAEELGDDIQMGLFGSRRGEGATPPI
jgi:hypothetical protein